MSVTETPQGGSPGRDAASSIRRTVNDYIAELARRLDDGDDELFDSYVSAATYAAARRRG